jgi:SSS family solute:Na+ symporter
MKTLDWIVLAASLLTITLFGLWKGRGSKTLQGFLLADRSLKWYTVAFSIMATQASAITFTSTPGQAYVDGMRFVQFYFGLPLAMIILSVTAVPIFHRLNVYTAYEYIEQRFDAKMRVLTTLLFLISRGLAAGMTIYAPALVLSVMLRMDMTFTSLIIGGIVIIYTTFGGVKAVNKTDVLQFSVIMTGMVFAFFTAVSLLPSDVSFSDALSLAGTLNRLQAVDFSFDWSNRYNFWSGIIGGMFVALAYFGTDQSQVQRYLTGKSVRESRMGLLFNGIAKIPMQFFILLIGTMVFVFYVFTEPPVHFNPAGETVVRTSPFDKSFRSLEEEHHKVWNARADAAKAYLAAKNLNDESRMERANEALHTQQDEQDRIRREAGTLVAAANPRADGSDTNYIFLTFVLTYIPAGLVGLIIACIFAASMSSSSGELSALATISVIDIYKRFINPSPSEKRSLLVSRVMMAFWGVYGIAFAQYASHLGSLIEAVNILGSLFYGVMLGIFLLAFYAPRIGGTAAFIGGIIGEIVVLGFFWYSSVAWLWYSVIGCGVVVGVAAIVELIRWNRSRS